MSDTTPRHPIVQKWMRGDTDAGGCIAELERELAEAQRELEEVSRRQHISYLNYDAVEKLASERHTKWMAAETRAERAEAALEVERRDAERWRKARTMATKNDSHDRYGNGCHWSIGFFSDDSNKSIDAAIDERIKHG